jgi:hypothetical protein
VARSALMQKSVSMDELDFLHKNDACPTNRKLHLAAHSASLWRMSAAASSGSCLSTTLPVRLERAARRLIAGAKIGPDWYARLVWSVCGSRRVDMVSRGPSAGNPATPSGDQKKDRGEFEDPGQVDRETEIVARAARQSRIG